MRTLSAKVCLVLGGLLAVSDCGSSTGQPGTAGSAGTSGGAGKGTTGTAGAGGMTGPMGMAGKMGPTGMGGTGPTGTGGIPTVTMCTPGVQGAFITPCGYPMAGGTMLAAVTFSEDEVLRAIEPEGGAPTATVRMFYNDEHALTMGVRSVIVKTAAGSTTMDYPVSPLPMSPSSVMNPQTGTNDLVGDQSGLDQSLRPMWPVLYVTDVTTNPMNRAGDWQQGGRPVNPNAVFGSWKAAVRTVDKTKTPNTVVITPDADPAKNNWNLAGGDPVPAGLTNQGWGAEVRWTVALAAGHSYRMQVLVHDGDQNKAGGDSGEACVLFCAGGGGHEGEGGAGGSVPPPPAMCPTGYSACGGDIDVATCPSGTVCANGCCLPIVQ